MEDGHDDFIIGAPLNSENGYRALYLILGTNGWELNVFSKF